MMISLPVQKMSPTYETKGFITLEMRSDRSSHSARRPRRSRSFKNRSLRLNCPTNRECKNIQDGRGSSSTTFAGSSMGLNENSLLSVHHDHGEKVRCLIKLMNEERQRCQQIYCINSCINRSPIFQLRARRVRSLFALARHFDSKSTSGAKLGDSDEITLGKEPEQLPANQLGQEFSQMTLFS